MNLGWSDGGYGDLRAADSDRDEVRRLLDVARDEGRLDEAEHDRRVGALATAKTRGDLARVTTDLPERKGVREWADGMRVRGADRDDARRLLAEAAAQGRLGDQEYEHRLTALSTVVTYDELTVLLDGVPGWSGTQKPDVLTGTADRAKALATLAEAVADGRVKPVEAPALEANLRQARRRRDIDVLLAPLAERASDREREHTVEALAAAHRDGRLDATEYAERAGKAQEATSGKDLTPLVADLRGDERRLSETDRQSVADTLKRALDEGRLDLAEFDERVTAAHAATTVADVAPLVADLTTPPRPRRRNWTDTLFDRNVVNSALLAAPRFWILKLVWKATIVATLLGYVYLVVVDPLFTLVALTWALLAVLWLEAVVARAFAGPVRRRTAAVVEELGARLDQLRVAHPAIKAITLQYPASEDYKDDGEWTERERPGVAQINVTFTGQKKTVQPQLRDEITRLFWRSRLYPLSELWLMETGTYSEHRLETVRLAGSEKETLRHRYGPRPYGPYQDDVPT